MAMIAQLHYDYHYKDREISAQLELNLKRFNMQFTLAQYELDSMVMTYMVPYMPMDTGQFVNVTRAMSASIAGSGKVVAAAPPFGRFLYEGKVMVGESSGSPYAKLGERKKVTDRFLDFSKSAHPKVTDHWFDTAKENHGSQWVRRAKKIAGGG